MLRSGFFLLTLLFVSSLYAQKPSLWRTLGEVQFSQIEDKDLGYRISIPSFSENIRKLDGQRVKVRGYIIPLEEETGYFALSAFPYQNCFFCGNAGPETVMEVYASRPIDFRDGAVWLTGRLELNEEDLENHLMYILRDAELARD